MTIIRKKLLQCTPISRRLAFQIQSKSVDGNLNRKEKRQMKTNTCNRMNCFLLMGMVDSKATLLRPPTQYRYIIYDNCFFSLTLSLPSVVNVHFLLRDKCVTIIRKKLLQCTPISRRLAFQIQSKSVDGNLNRKEKRQMKTNT